MLKITLFKNKFAEISTLKLIIKDNFKNDDY